MNLLNPTGIYDLPESKVKYLPFASTLINPGFTQVEGFMPGKGKTKIMIEKINRIMQGTINILKKINIANTGQV